MLLIILNFWPVECSYPIVCWNGAWWGDYMEATILSIKFFFFPFFFVLNILGPWPMQPTESPNLAGLYLGFSLSWHEITPSGDPPLWLQTLPPATSKPPVFWVTRSNSFQFSPCWLPPASLNTWMTGSLAVAVWTFRSSSFSSSGPSWL